MSSLESVCLKVVILRGTTLVGVGERNIGSCRSSVKAGLTMSVCAASNCIGSRAAGAVVGLMEWRRRGFQIFKPFRMKSLFLCGLVLAGGAVLRFMLKERLWEYVGLQALQEGIATKSLLLVLV